MTTKPADRSLPVRGTAAGPLERIGQVDWQRADEAAQAIRSLGETPLSKAIAVQLADQLGVSWRTVYRYRDRLQGADEAVAVLGRKRGWKPTASRLSAEQEEAITDAIRRLRKKPGPVRVMG